MGCNKTVITVVNSTIVATCSITYLNGAVSTSTWSALEPSDPLYNPYFSKYIRVPLGVRTCCDECSNIDISIVEVNPIPGSMLKLYTSIPELGIENQENLDICALDPPVTPSTLYEFNIVIYSTETEKPTVLPDPKWSYTIIIKCADVVLYTIVYTIQSVVE